ncbi:hypothetical protein USB125703_00926 [Pseudoclavibacter triregionum]|nr:hypothetical protein USB125703_00926 [Pseudoclavibacter triregionum]
MGIASVVAPQSEELSVEESRAQMDALIRDRLGIGREEFLRRVDVGEYADEDDDQVLMLLTLVPFAR